MTRKNVLVSLFAVVGIAGIAGSIAFGQPSKDKKAPTAPAGQPEMKLPPGWTQEDMNACMEAGMPGEMHKHLAKYVGTWTGKTTMWMAPNTDPIQNECTAVSTSMMDGRFIKTEVSGEMPGMGPFNGMAINGYDNVTKKFVNTWIDNFGTGIMTGTGDIASDKKTVTYTCAMSCPIQKKSVSCRQVETWTSPTTFTMDMYGPDPKTGKEYHSMHIEYTKK